MAPQPPVEDALCSKYETEDSNAANLIYRGFEGSNRRELEEYMASIMLNKQITPNMVDDMTFDEEDEDGSVNTKYLLECPLLHPSDIENIRSSINAHLLPLPNSPEAMNVVILYILYK